VIPGDGGHGCGRGREINLRLDTRLERKQRRSPSFALNDAASSDEFGPVVVVVVVVSVGGGSADQQQQPNSISRHHRSTLSQHGSVASPFGQRA